MFDKEDISDFSLSTLKVLKGSIKYKIVHKNIIAKQNFSKIVFRTLLYLRYSLN